MTREEAVALAEEIAAKILADVTDRRGWRQAWDDFDANVREEIKRDHSTLAENVLRSKQKVSISEDERVADILEGIVHFGDALRGRDDALSRSLREWIWEAESWLRSRKES